ncbi:unnamed protein product [Nyctereutes procyonoides]|uniref:Alpha-1A adrenergic receptor n=1 Tax=Nyctereutes procyonoides TaxID=34880 RepID=A0A811ZDS6_NYCPR|nr:unnamed protein product [Nyctereutes procyonoides]
MVFLSGNASDSSNCTHPPAPVNISKAILLGVILGGLIIFGVLGNILVILSVACHRHLHSVTHYYIVNLAVADLLLTSTVLPFSAIFEILGYWAFGRVFCNIWAAVDVLCCTASIMGLCIISIDRYIGVSYPLRYPTIVTQKRGLMALLCVWALSLVISIGPLFGWRQPAPEDETICQITEEPGYVLFSALGSFYVPLTIILVMYCRVYVVAKRESRGLKSGLKTDKSDSEQVTLRIHRKNAPVGGPGVSSAKNKTHFSVRLLKFSREKKAAKTLGIVVGCFVLCWLPFFLVMPIADFPLCQPVILALFLEVHHSFELIYITLYLSHCFPAFLHPISYFLLKFIHASSAYRALNTIPDYPTPHTSYNTTLHTQHPPHHTTPYHTTPHHTHHTTPYTLHTIPHHTTSHIPRIPHRQVGWIRSLPSHAGCNFHGDFLPYYCLKCGLLL